MSAPLMSAATPLSTATRTANAVNNTRPERHILTAAEDSPEHRKCASLLLPFAIDSTSSLDLDVASNLTVAAPEIQLESRHDESSHLPGIGRRCRDCCHRFRARCLCANPQT